MDTNLLFSHVNQKNLPAVGCLLEAKYTLCAMLHALCEKLVANAKFFCTLERATRSNRLMHLL
jgi:hypothetical protein